MATCEGCGTTTGCHASNCPIRYPQKKLTFDEWYVSQFGNKTLVNYDTYAWVWDAAQENK